MGSNAEAVAIYRIALGVMLLVELTTRFQYLHPFYSDEGVDNVLINVTSLLVINNKDIASQTSHAENRLNI
eukprot:scaffold364086_cov93-Cyclotella_meneghiniana.AAC.1